jgi:tRNA uridine 5-carboxymethylaminomethyl modification enzyme
LKRPELNLDILKKNNKALNEILFKYNSETIEQAEIQIKYETYIDKERKLAEKIENLENYKIPLKFNYDKLSSLSTEGKEKLNRIRPLTIGQATRISGVSPADISILMVYMGK